MSKSRTDHATKMTDVVETCTRDRRDVIEGKMRIKNETQVKSRGSRRNRVTIGEKKNRIMIYLTEV